MCHRDGEEELVINTSQNTVHYLTSLFPVTQFLQTVDLTYKILVGSHCARLSIPAFTKGKTQLSGIDVDQSRQIANIRIHVERVIGNIRQKFSRLSATQPIEFVSSTENVTTLDKIVHVACCLINMCDSVIPFD